MTRAVKHFDLHQVAGIELRVVSDVENGVLGVIDAEDSVVRRYVERGLWRHSWVDLFILQDLQSLAQQLAEVGDLPPGGSQAVDRRPVMNAYDLADLSGCHGFVNRRVMGEVGYWTDRGALRARLANEHAHPLSENQTTRVSRRLRLVTATGREEDESTASGSVSLFTLAGLLADKLCCYAPREIFANEFAITGGFAEDLFHLDQRVMAAAARGVLARGELVRHVESEVTEGRLSAAKAEQLLLVGDLRGYLDLALETVPFHRAGRSDRAAMLEQVLFEHVFPRLGPEVEGIYRAVCGLYAELGPDLTGPALASWGRRVLELLAGLLQERGLELALSLDYSEDEEGRDA